MGTVGTADQDNPAIPFSFSATTENVRRSRGQFEAVTSALERLADLAAVMSAVLFARFAYGLLQVGRQVHYSNGTIVTAALAARGAMGLILAWLCL